MCFYSQKRGIIAATPAQAVSVIGDSAGKINLKIQTFLRHHCHEFALGKFKKKPYYFIHTFVFFSAVHIISFNILRNDI